MKIMGIDKEIETIVYALNKAGFKTVGSCAGHKDMPTEHSGRGFISFDTVYPELPLISAAVWYGLKHVEYQVITDRDDGDWCSLTFDPIGEPYSRWWAQDIKWIELMKKGMDPDEALIESRKMVVKIGG